MPFTIAFFAFKALALALSAAAAKSLQSCPTLCNPKDGTLPGSPVPGILQARTLEWVAISFSSSWKWKVKGKSLSCVLLLATPWTAAYQAPPSMGFSRQEYWSGVPFGREGQRLPSSLSMPSSWKSNFLLLYLNNFLGLLLFLFFFHVSRRNAKAPSNPRDLTLQRTPLL